MNEREKLDAQEQRLEIFRSVDWRCENCSRNLAWFGTPQLAHRIAQTKGALKKYGPEVIHHKFNLAPVCCLKCNDSVNIGNRPVQVAELVERIRADLGEKNHDHSHNA